MSELRDILTNKKEIEKELESNTFDKYDLSLFKRNQTRIDQTRSCEW